MTSVWILVTLITDWNTVFYRKAIIYKRRVDEELASMASKKQHYKSSITSGSNTDNSSRYWPKNIGSMYGTSDGIIWKTQDMAEFDTDRLIRNQKE